MCKSRDDIDGLSADELRLLLVQALEGISALKLENAALREEIARLKGLKGKPDNRSRHHPAINNPNAAVNALKRYSAG